MRRPTSLALLIFVACALTLLPDAAVARRGGWLLLGERNVTDGAERDVINVTAARGDFRKIQIRVYERPVQFHAVRLHFANDTVQEVEMRQVIEAGGASRVIDLDGGERVLSAVELRYDAQAAHGRSARVKVFARR
jgi:hypothetical protein